MLRLIARGTFTTQVKRYILGGKPWSRALNKQIMPNYVETQHNHMYSYYIGSLCNIAFSMTRFTSIMTSKVFVNI